MAWPAASTTIGESARAAPLEHIKKIATRRKYVPSLCGKAFTICSRSSGSLLLRLLTGLLCWFQPALDQQRFHARIAAAEGTIHRVGVFGVAARQHHVAESLAVLARHAAMFFEPIERVVAQHGGP